MLVEIETKIRKAEEALKKIHYSQEQISAREFHDYTTGETFSGDTTTISDVLGNEFLMFHELVEMSELKKWESKSTNARLWSLQNPRYTPPISPQWNKSSTTLSSGRIFLG